MFPNDNAETDIVLSSGGNITANGDVAAQLIQHNMDPGVMRPFQEADGSCWITVNEGTPRERTIQTNAQATLRKDEWMLLDKTVIEVAKPRLEAWGDLMRRGLKYTVPNGMGVTVLQHQTMSDITGAITSMDGLRQSDRDRPVFTLENLPLPIIHKDGGFTLREIMTGRRMGTPIDTMTIQLATTRVVEEVEKYLTGANPVYTYSSGSIYGYKNYPNRITYSMTNPTTPDWTPATFLQEILEMKKASQDARYYGPWQVYVSTAWDTYLDNDFSPQYPNLTLRQRISAIAGLTTPKTLDYLDLTGAAFNVIMVQMTNTVVEGVEGMGLTVFRWNTEGGFDTRFKVACIMVPRLRKDQNSNTGLIHGAA